MTEKTCKRGHVGEYNTSGRCRICQREAWKIRYADPTRRAEAVTRAREWKAANLEKARAGGRARYAKDPSKIKANRQRYRLKNIDAYRARGRAQYRAQRARNIEAHRARLRRGAGLPEPTRAAPERCECCGGLPNGKNHSLHLDHCHETGRFRGWLCFRCNSAIGKLGDTIDGVLRAASYLAKS